MSRFTILGCGYTGTVVDQKLRDTGHEVVCTSTNGAEKTIKFNALEDSLGDWANDSHLIYSIPTLFKKIPEDDAHLKPLRSVIDALEAGRISGITYLSATSVYGDHNGAIVNETSKCRPTSPYGKMRLSLETMLMRASLANTSSIRIGGIYGQGRTIDGRLENGKFQMVDGGAKLSNRIHVDDLANIIVNAATRSLSSYKTFLAVDGNPMPVRAVIDWVCERLNLDLPSDVTLADYAENHGVNNAARWATSIRCDPSRTLEELEISLEYPTVIDGYEAIFAV